MDKKIGIILPTYNEEENIAGLLQEIHSIIPYATVIVVDDSPNEATAIAAQNVINQIRLGLGTESKLDFRVMKRVNASGRADAVRAGFQVLAKENFDYAIEMDTDGSHPPKQLPELIQTAISQQADIVICSRNLPESKVTGWPLARHFLHFLAVTSCQVLLRAGIYDYMNAYRIYSKRALHIVLNEAGKISTGFWAFGEPLVHIKHRGGKVLEIPTHFVNRTRGKSQVKLRVIFSCISELFMVFYLKQKLKRKALNF